MTPDAPRAIDADLPTTASTGVSRAGLSPAEEVFVIRAFRMGDIAYVRDSWLRTAWDAENQKLKARRVSQKERAKAGAAWYVVNRPHVTALLAAPDVTVLVAVDRLDDNHIAGWIAVRAGRRIAGAVKQAYRRDQGGTSWGVNEMLCQAAGIAERGE